MLNIWGCRAEDKAIFNTPILDSSCSLIICLCLLLYTEICHADTNLQRLTQIYTYAPVLFDGSLFLFCECVVVRCKKRGEAKLDLSRDNSSGDLKCLVGMISLNHLITYITAAACSAVCQTVCVCFQSISVCISIYVCLCSDKQALKSYDWPGSVCLNMW